jgi:hypothetical protein
MEEVLVSSIAFQNELRRQHCSSCIGAAILQIAPVSRQTAAKHFIEAKNRDR